MNTEKKIPLRKCAGCNERKPKKELVRILRTENGIIIEAVPDEIYAQLKEEFQKTE